MTRMIGRSGQRSIGWSAVLLLHALVLVAAFSAGGRSSPHRTPGSEAPRSVMVLLRAAMPGTAVPRQHTAPLPVLPTAERPRPRTPSLQAVEHRPGFGAAAAVQAEPAAAPTLASVQPVVAVAVSVEPAADPMPQPASFARPDHAQCPHANYPMPLRERGIEGTVLLRVRVDTEGRPADVHLLQASGWRLFDEAALQAVRACRFIPARRDGTALTSWVEFPVRFALAG